MAFSTILTLALWAMLLRLTFSLPTHSSIQLAKRASPKSSSRCADQVRIAKVKAGIVDTCFLAHAGYTEVTAKQKGASRIYDQYFPNGNNGFDLQNVGTVFGGILQVTFDGTAKGDCADLLSQITISGDFPNPDNNNELSCTDDSVMASMRYARSATQAPITIICPKSKETLDLPKSLLGVKIRLPR